MVNGYPETSELLVIEKDAVIEFMKTLDFQTDVRPGILFDEGFEIHFMASMMTFDHIRNRNDHIRNRTVEPPLNFEIKS